MKTKQPGQTPEFLSTNLKENLETLSLLLNDPSDLTTKVLQVGAVHIPQPLSAWKDYPIS